MKLIMGLLFLILSTVASASMDSKDFVYDGSQNSIELLLKAEKTHTEYRYEDRIEICYRTEIVGYHTICSSGGPGWPPTCWQEPIIRTVAFPCRQTVRVPFEVKDYDVEARVIVDVTKVSPEVTSGETINATLDGDVLSFMALGSKKFFIVEAKKDIRSSMKGNVKYIDALLAVDLVESVETMKAIKMTNIVMKDSELKFAIGPVQDVKTLGFSLHIENRKLFGSDTVLFNRNLKDSEVVVANTSTGAEASVNIPGLGVELKGGKYALTAKTFVKLHGPIMNAKQFELSAGRTLILKK